VFEQVGRYVKVLNLMIPAVNIQIEGFPQRMDGQWYGIYFETRWESGRIWEVELGFENGSLDEPIIVTVTDERPGPFHKHEKVMTFVGNGYLSKYAEFALKYKQACKWLR